MDPGALGGLCGCTCLQGLEVRQGTETAPIRPNPQHRPVQAVLGADLGTGARGISRVSARSAPPPQNTTQPPPPSWAPTANSAGSGARIVLYSVKTNAFTIPDGVVNESLPCSNRQSTGASMEIHVRQRQETRATQNRHL